MIAAPPSSPVVEPGAFERLAPGVIGVVVPLFLCLADARIPFAPWTATATRVLLATWLLAAAPLVLRRWRLVVALACRPPLVFFTAFSVLAFVAVPTAALPLGESIRYAAGYAALEAACAAIALLFPLRALVSWVFVGTAARVFASLALHLLGPRGDGGRLEGVHGNPNPTGATAGLCLLLGLALRLSSRGESPPPGLLAPILAAALFVLAATRSVSAVLVTIATGAVVAGVEGRRRGRLSARSLAAAVVLGGAFLAAVVASRRADLVVHLGARLSWFRDVVEVAWRRPLLGYGPGSSPLVLDPLRHGVWTSGHNVVLEAWLYAGVGGAVALLAFVATLAILGLDAAKRDPRALGLATLSVFYPLLSLVEPAILNAGPTTLVAPLLAAAALSAARPGPSGAREIIGRDPSDGRDGGTAKGPTREMR